MAKDSFWLPETKKNEETKKILEKPSKKLNCPVKVQGII